MEKTLPFPIHLCRSGGESWKGKRGGRKRQQPEGERGRKRGTRTEEGAEEGERERERIELFLA